MSEHVPPPGTGDSPGDGEPPSSTLPDSPTPPGWQPQTVTPPGQPTPSWQQPPPPPPPGPGFGQPLPPGAPQPGQPWSQPGQGWSQPGQGFGQPAPPGSPQPPPPGPGWQQGPPGYPAGQGGAPTGPGGPPPGYGQPNPIWQGAPLQPPSWGGQPGYGGQQAGFGYGAGPFVPKRSKTVAVVLAVFLSFWTWAYTWREDKVKFWIGLGVETVLLVLGIATATARRIASAQLGVTHPRHGPILGLFFLVAFGIWIWAIVDQARKSPEWYAAYGRH